MTLCRALIVFVESRYQLRDVFSDPHGGHSDQRTLNVVPEFECLILSADTVARDRSEMGFGGRVEDLARRLREEDRRQERTAGDRRSQEHVRSRAELLAPIRGGIDLVLQFPEM